MKLFFSLIVFLCLCSTNVLLSANTEEVLILNQPDEVELKLRRFRMMTDPFQMRIGSDISRIGLSTMKASGSAQFSKQSFQTLLSVLPKSQLTVIDLRQESHGFLNEMPVSWYSPKDWANMGMTLTEIIKDEQDRLQELLQKKEVTLRQLIHDNGVTSVRTLTVNVQSVSTEEALCQQAQVKYLRIPVTDHYPPDNTQLDRFVAFVKQIPEEMWIHFHCAGGMGRTTTFLALYDMIRNASYVSFDDILNRQWMLGGENLFADENQSFRKWPSQFTMRQQMLQEFYNYCKDNPDDFATSWSEWLKAKNIHTFDNIQ